MGMSRGNPLITDSKDFGIYHMKWKFVKSFSDNITSNLSHTHGDCTARLAHGQINQFRQKRGQKTPLRCTVRTCKKHSS